MIKIFYCLLFLSLEFAAFSQTVPDTIISIKEGNPDTSIVHFDGGWYDHQKQHDVLMGKASRAFRLADYQGVVHDLEMYKGKILILYFWGIWSWDSCEGQTIALNKIADKYSKEAAVLSIVTETMGIDELGFLQDHPVHFPIIPNAWDFGMAYHGYNTGIPVVFFIDGEGIVRDARFMPGELESALKLLLK